MAKYKCAVCEFIYDEETGDEEAGMEPGTKFGDLPDEWTCPSCGAEKREFERLDEDEE